MILKDEDASRRLNSPMNLINRLRNSSNGSSRKSAMQLFIGRSADKKKEVSSAAISDGSDSGGVTHPPENTLEVSFNPFVKISPPQIEPPTPTIDTILTNTDSQIKLGLAHDKALDLLTKSLDSLSAKLDDVKADKIPQVILAASKTVDGIRRERNEAAKNNRDREVHYHFYTPEQRKVEEFEIIDIGQPAASEVS